MSKNGLTYYQAETDRFQDIKIKRLKKRFGCQGYAVYNYVQNEIYRVEGCFIRFTDDQAFDCAEYWNIDEEEVMDIINFCADIELFDAVIWKTRGILTSREIQRRYTEICRRAKKRMFIPDEIALIEDERIETVQPEPLPLFADEGVETVSGTPSYGQPELAVPQNSAELRGIPRKSAENPDKEKKNKINPPSIPPQGGGKLEEEVHKLRSRLEGTPPFSPTPPDDGIRRNPTGILERLQQLRIPPKEIEQLLLLCRYGEIGHPIWALLEDIRLSRGKITMPGRFLLARLKAS